MDDRYWAGLLGLLVVALVVGLAMGVGLVFAAIVGGSAALAYVVWLGTTYRRPVDPDEVRSLYLLVIAGELVHQVEEYVADFPRHLSAGFHLTGFTQDRFVVMILLLAAVGLVAAVGLEYRHPGANYVMWFVVVGPGFVNGAAHVLFPLVLGQPYFPGLLTVWLPLVPGVVLIRRVVVDSRPAAGRIGS